MSSDEWQEDCIRRHGKVLTGKYAHWCYDWDLLPIDETCKYEFDCCHCNKEEIETANRKDKQ